MPSKQAVGRTHDNPFIFPIRSAYITKRAVLLFQTLDIPVYQTRKHIHTHWEQEQVMRVVGPTPSQSRVQMGAFEPEVSDESYKVMGRMNKLKPNRRRWASAARESGVSRSNKKNGSKPHTKIKRK
jgi:hypothetical protein